MVVTPLRDGMNLVAKEYVACRHDDDGALVLSEFAGAADELERRRSRMVTAVERLGADQRLDVVPTSRYRWWFPSAEELRSGSA